MGDFPGGSEVKNSPSNAGDVGSIPRLERSPVGGNGNPQQYSCLGNLMNRGAWWDIVHGPCHKRVGHGWVTKHNVLLIVPSLSSYFLVCFVIFNYQLILHGTLPMVGTLLGMQSSFRVICVYFRFLLYKTGQLNSECRTAKTRASLLILRKLFFFLST